MKVLVVGASGATGSKLVDRLLQLGHEAKIVVRSTANIPEKWPANENLEIITASILELSDAALIACVEGCHAVACCLGHNMTFKGMLGKPRRLVRDATARLCTAIEVSKPVKPIKYVLMSSSGVRNRDLNEPISFAQKIVIGLLRLLLPPHIDNEQAADFLRMQIGQKHPVIEWCAVRPDGLIDEAAVTEYELHPSPTRSAIFDAGKVSRINVAHCMAQLIHDDALWTTWKGQMPVIYGASQIDE